MRYLFSTLIIAHLLFSACSSSKKAIELTLQPTGNQSFIYVSTNTTETSVSMMGMDQKILMEQTAKQQYDIKKVNSDGTFDLTVTTKSMKMEQVNPMMNMRFDSDNPANNEPEGMMDGLSNMIGKSFDVVVDKQGDVKSVSMEGKLFDGVFDNVPGGEQMAAQFESQFGESAIKSALNQTLGFFPDKPVKVGDSWVKSTTSEMGMKLDLQTTYTLKERKNGNASIEFVSNVATSPSEAPLEMMGMTMSYDMKGTLKGTILVNEKTGWAIKNSGEQSMKGKMNMSGAGMGEMSADMDVITKYNYEKIE
ncbi:MAG: hypothetical protein HC912_07120 [Saprospiraceae bacterium]|nr:hypothetical protein [Saprospiraceae bacterium]